MVLIFCVSARKYPRLVLFVALILGAVLVPLPNTATNKKLPSVYGVKTTMTAAVYLPNGGGSSVVFHY